MSNWRVRRGENGWFVYEWSYQTEDGKLLRVASYPTPHKWYYVPLYPWMVAQSVKAIIQLRKVVYEYA